MFKEIISNLWFSDKESVIYIACLELWNAPVSSIARRSWENRITTYNILKDLKSRWISQELIKNKIKYFSVISTDILLKKEKEKLSKLENAIPEFLAITNSFWNKPKVLYYEWVDWLIEIYENLLTSTTDIKAFLWFSDIKNKKFKGYAEKEFLPKRIKKHIFAKVILPNTKWNVEYKNLDKKYNRESILLDKNIYKMKNEINLYSWNKIAISLFSENEVWWLIIESKSLHESLESLFDLIWFSNKK